MSEERVAVFIDGSNLYRCLKDEFGTSRIDLGRLAHTLVGSRSLVRAYYYNATVHKDYSEEMHRKQQAFFEKLRNLPYFQVRLGRLEPRGNIVVEKGVDVLLSVDMVRYACENVYDTAVLVSGDSDYAPVVDAVKDKGKHVENAFTQTGSSRHLRNAADTFTELDSGLISSIMLP